MGYLIGGKFLNFLEAAETDGQWRQAIPAFVAKIKALFEPFELSEFLNTPRRLGRWAILPTTKGTGCCVRPWKRSNGFGRTPET